ncbi:MAG TPA: hypothetical protein VNK48_16660 [Xanthobacteraceae bacterium]|nr:hypothetical protein [Xanthobacteraceae bacterium]
MDNYTLTRADRATHLKILAVSLFAGMIVIGLGFAARPPSDGTLAIDANAVTLGTNKPISSPNREQAALR